MPTESSLEYNEEPSTMLHSRTARIELLTETAELCAREAKITADRLFGELPSSVENLADESDCLVGSLAHMDSKLEKLNDVLIALSIQVTRVGQL